MTTNSANYELSKMEHLVGGKVTGLIKSPLNMFGETEFGLKINNKGESFILWILKDAEGNGPGSVHVTPYDG